MTLNRKKKSFRGHYVSHERTFRGHLKKSRAKSPFFEGQMYKHTFICHNLSQIELYLQLDTMM